MVESHWRSQLRTSIARSLAHLQSALQTEATNHDDRSVYLGPVAMLVSCLCECGDVCPVFFMCATTSELDRSFAGRSAPTTSKVQGK